MTDLRGGLAPAWSSSTVLAANFFVTLVDCSPGGGGGGGVDWCYLTVSRWFDSSAISFHQAMKPILSIVYVECRTSRENVDKHTGCKDWENSLFYENINLLLNRIARPLCGHPSKQEVWFSIQSGDPLTTVARSTKSIDIPGYNRSNTRIMRSLKTINNG